MSYCTVDDVCTAFPRFVRNAAGSIQDTQIQGWIDDRKARIRSALSARGPSIPTPWSLTPDQANFLRALNRDGAIADLGDALQGNVSLQPGEYSHAGERRKSFERQIDEIKQGLYDSSVRQHIAQHVEIEPLLGRHGGRRDRPLHRVRPRGEQGVFEDNLFDWRIVGIKGSRTSAALHTLKMWQSYYNAGLSKQVVRQLLAIVSATFRRRWISSPACPALTRPSPNTIWRCSRWSSSRRSC